jgi:hypothetical protein
VGDKNRLHLTGTEQVPLGRFQQSSLLDASGGQVLGFVHRSAQLFGQQAAKAAVANGGSVGGD